MDNELLIEELISRILQTENPDDIIEALDISTEELLENFKDKLEDNRYKFHYLEVENYLPEDYEE